MTESQISELKPEQHPKPSFWQLLLQNYKAISVVVLIGLAAWWLYQTISAKQSWVLIFGVVLGFTLSRAAFGFTTAWRNFISMGRGKGLRAQMVMLAISVCLFFPALAGGELFGSPVSGFLRPLGLSVIFGAFIFGVGMQLGNGCASGNLYHVGEGQMRAVPSMIGFMIGALWATADYEWWTSLPQLAPVSTIEILGPLWAIIANLAVFALIAYLTVFIERRRHGQLEQEENSGSGSLLHKLISGPWPYIWGAVVLALMNFATLALIGRPWTVALAYPLWGAKVAQWFEMDLDFDFWIYWLQPGRETALQESLLMDVTTVMNVGIIFGAIMAAVAAKKFTFEWRLPWQHWLAASIGGLMLGYGATIAYGCNIGAYFGGIVSGSLHGWLWLVAAFLGSWVGTGLRPLFKLPKSDKPASA
jgi:uncharacterized membrane protein YedE/YeeE